MHCHELHEWMSLKLDGRLPDAEARRFEAHLKDCSACAEEWRLWQEIGDLFAGAPSVEPPQDLAARVMVRIQRQPRPAALGGSLLAMGLGLAVLGGVAAVPMLVVACLTVATTAETPGLLAIAASAAAHVLEIAAAAAEALRLLLWAAVRSPSAVMAPVYAFVTAGILVIWLRVAIFRRAPAASGGRR